MSYQDPFNSLNEMEKAQRQANLSPKGEGNRPLSRRDQFAMAAMQGLLASKYAGAVIIHAVELADSLIAELENNNA